MLTRLQTVDLLAWCTGGELMGKDPGTNLPFPSPAAQTLAESGPALGKRGSEAAHAQLSYSQETGLLSAPAP